MSEDRQIRLATFCLDNNNDIVFVTMVSSNEKRIFPRFGFVVVVDTLTFLAGVVDPADIDEDCFLDIADGWNVKRRILGVIPPLGRGRSRFQT